MSNRAPTALLPLPEPQWVMPESMAGKWKTPGAWSAEQVEAIRRETVMACADCIPTSWLDSLLTGPDAVAASDTEALLLAVKDRILALLKA